MKVCHWVCRFCFWKGMQKKNRRNARTEDVNVCLFTSVFSPHNVSCAISVVFGLLTKCRTPPSPHRLNISAEKKKCVWAPRTFCGTMLAAWMLYSKCQRRSTANTFIHFKLSNGIYGKLDAREQARKNQKQREGIGNSEWVCVCANESAFLRCCTLMVWHPEALDRMYCGLL